MVGELGIAITTFNRREKLARCLDRIFRHTRTPFELIVADDGSEDSTREMLTSRQIPFVSGQNRGIAWNKNRGLFFLSQIRPCSTIILIEDDCFPTFDGWERPWVEAAIRWGHINNAAIGLRPHILSGAGTVTDPFVTRLVSGQCASFALKALRWVGYLDTRFGRYGHEHVEHTLRLLKMGFGGRFANTQSDVSEFLLIEGQIFVDFDHSNRDEISLAENALVFAAIRDDPIYRLAWRNDVEMENLKREMDCYFPGVRANRTEDRK